MYLTLSGSVVLNGYTSHCSGPTGLTQPFKFFGHSGTLAPSMALNALLDSFLAPLENAWDRKG